MERNIVLDYAESLVDRLEGEEYNPVEALRGVQTRRILHAKTTQLSLFDQILRHQIMIEKDLMLCTTSTGREELDALQGLQKALNQRRVIDKDPTSKKPHLERLALSGVQISLMSDFIEDYYLFDSHEYIDEEAKSQMHSFVKSLAKDYPLGKRVVKEGKIGKIFSRFTRQK